MLEFAQLYFKKGVRTISGLTNPPLSPFVEFKFPKDSIWHYIPETEGEALPDPEDITDHAPSYLVDLVTEYLAKSTVGHHTSVSVNALKNEAVQKVRQYVKGIDISILRRSVELIKDRHAVIVESYEPLLKTYRYTHQPLTDYIRWKEIFQTVCMRINQLAQTTHRHHFIMVPLTTAIPSLSEFRKASVAPTTVNIKPFLESDTLIHLDLLKWVGDARDSAVMNELDPAIYSKVNFVLYTEDQHGKRHEYTLINLGWLDSLRVDNKVEKDTAVYKPDQCQKVVLKMFNQIVLKGFIDENEEDGEVVITEFPDIELTNNDDAVKPPLTDDLIEHVDEEDLDKELAKMELRKQTLAPANKLKELAPEEATPYAFQTPSLLDRIEQSADDMVAQGLYSPSEANHFKNNAKRFKTLENPFGEGTLEEFAHIDKAHLVIQPTKFKDRTSITEKGMLESSLNDFDSRYIKDFFYKDIVNFSLSLQKAGIVINDYSVEPIVDIANDAYRFKMTVQPIPGKQSTLSFDIPRVGKDGVMFSGGVKYFLKKQEAELPIRKISPYRVALTSYYGKIFVDKKEVVKNNYEKWLLNNLTRIGIDKEDDRIPSFKTGNVFERSVVLPRAFTILAKRFTQLDIKPVEGDAKGLVLNLSFYYNEKIWHPSGKLHVGFCGEQLVLMDRDGVYYLTSNINSPIGTLEDMLALDVTKAPLEAVVVNVFGKRVSMGIVLGMRMGFSTLVRTLGASYRRVEAGKQLNLQPHEYRLRFRNESWIFSRKDKLATLVLGGMQDYARSLVKFHSGLFDAKDVYTAVLEEAGLSPRYYNEIDTFSDMFIDHITQQLLEDMHEPTEMMGLLLRATELLMTDAHPDEADTSFTRIRGYERIGGLVYNQLVQSLRSMNSLPKNKRRYLDLNPQAVKMALITDSAKELYDEINPIHALKQNEIVTLGGTGGRSFDALSKNVRGYHKNSMGTISESTVDSSNVGAIKYLSANPMLTTLRGRRATYEKSKNNVVNLLSTSALLAPAAEHDDQLVSIAGNCYAKFSLIDGNMLRALSTKLY